MVGLRIGWLTSMLIKPPPELKMHVIVATGLGRAFQLELLLGCGCILLLSVHAYIHD